MSERPATTKREREREFDGAVRERRDVQTERERRRRTVFFVFYVFFSSVFSQFFSSLRKTHSLFFPVSSLFNFPVPFLQFLLPFLNSFSFSPARKMI